MEVRTIKPEEMLEFLKLQSIAFLFKNDFSDYESNPEKYQEDSDLIRAVFDDEGLLCAGIYLIPFLTRFDGHKVKMGGIGGVVSLPEKRRRGYIRRVTELAMEEMYADDYVFSHLYPFSYEYYRKFGYEFNMTELEYKIPVLGLNKYEQRGSLKMYVPGMDKQDIMDVYDGFLKDVNLSLYRDDKRWARILDKEPSSTNVFSYIWYNNKDEARGYFQFDVERDEASGVSNMRVMDFMWLDLEALFGLFNFISGFYHQFKNVIIRLPSYVDLKGVLREPVEIEEKVIIRGMNRIVNVKKALELMQVPSGEGEFLIGLRDDFFMKNTASYLYSWSQGESQVKVNPKGKEVDLVTSVHRLSQMLTGFYSPSMLHEQGLIDLKSDGQKADSIFTKKKLFLPDYF